MTQTNTKSGKSRPVRYSSSYHGGGKGGKDSGIHVHDGPVYVHETPSAPPSAPSAPAAKPAAVTTPEKKKESMFGFKTGVAVGTTAAVGTAVGVGLATGVITGEDIGDAFKDA